MKNRFLTVETSCDETAVSLWEVGIDGSMFEFKRLFSYVLSQVDIHKKYGGVFPSLAKIEHKKNLPVVLDILRNEVGDMVEYVQISGGNDYGDDHLNSLQESLVGKMVPVVDGVYVTAGPGLAPALWVGCNFATIIAREIGCWVRPVNHMAGHFYSVFIDGDEFQIDVDKLGFPQLALLVSGGHTELVVSESVGEFRRLGVTMDDAVGEAFDKVARLLGLEYPGGPKISMLADQGRRLGLKPDFKLPRPMISSGDLNFSFSGLKTAVLRLVRGIEGEMSDEFRMMIAMEFEDSVADVLVKKLTMAADMIDPEVCIFAGGVSANRYLRKRLSEVFDGEVLVPAPGLSGDNSDMILVAGVLCDSVRGDMRLMDGKVEAKSNWSIDMCNS